MATLRKRFIAKLLAVDAAIFLQLFQGLDSDSHRNAYLDGNRKTEYSDPEWALYFQARAGAFLVQKEVMEFLLDFGAEEALQSVPSCTLQTNFPFHSRHDSSFIDSALSVLSEDPAIQKAGTGATDLANTIKNPDYELYSKKWEEYRKFEDEEIEKFKNTRARAVEQGTGAIASSPDLSNSLRRSPRRSSQGSRVKDSASPPRREKPSSLSPDPSKADLIGYAIGSHYKNGLPKMGHFIKKETSHVRSRRRVVRPVRARFNIKICP